MIMYRANVARALKGKRGQAFLREMLAALDAMPVKRLIIGEFEDTEGEVCALGVVGRARGDQCSVQLDVPEWANPDTAAVGRHFGIAECMAAEIMWINDDEDDGIYWHDGFTPEQRWSRVRGWVVKQIQSGGDANPHD